MAAAARCLAAAAVLSQRLVPHMRSRCPSDNELKCEPEWPTLFDLNGTVYMPGSAVLSLRQGRTPAAVSARHLDSLSMQGFADSMLQFAQDRGVAREVSAVQDAHPQDWWTRIEPLSEQMQLLTRLTPASRRYGARHRPGGRGPCPQQGRSPQGGAPRPFPAP
eukprot:TRINITY_DN18271_c0_g1_i2.p1 TRINITY_DN18271_c0_g1~~TRINITY_DN18271_c0_g1_i2.p1  ORF type:complete len:186 (+),score=23.48 TRINITY_DN18271_c0_g1_i2:70-558(+)